MKLTLVTFQVIPLFKRLHRQNQSWIRIVVFFWYQVAQRQEVWTRTSHSSKNIHTAGKTCQNWDTFQLKIERSSFHQTLGSAVRAAGHSNPHIRLLTASSGLPKLNEYCVLKCKWGVFFHMQWRLTGTSSKGGSHSGKKRVRANNARKSWTQTGINFTQREGEAVKGPNQQRSSQTGKHPAQGAKRTGAKAKKTTRGRKTEQGAAAQELLSK